MTPRTLSLSLLLLGSGLCSLASAHPRNIRVSSYVCKPKPASEALKNYIDQTEVATQGFVAVGHELESVLSRLNARSEAIDQTQADEKESKWNASTAKDPQLLAGIDKLRTAIRAFRNFNPVPHSAAKIDAKFVDFSLKMEHGLDSLQLSMAAPDDQELQDKALGQLEEAMDVLPLAAEEILALKQSLDAQSVRKTYVRG